MALDVQALAEVFKEAKAAALAADRPDDGGTCNYDTPAFGMPKVRASEIDKAAAIAGVSIDVFSRFGGRCFLVNVPLHGQGARRERMMEAAQAVLKRAQESGRFPGMVACGWYQMD